MELYLIRHAQSTNNALTSPEERVSDPALTELGEQQAQRLAEYLSRAPTLDQARRKVKYPTESGDWGYNFTHLYCSPMYRSLKTTLYISQKLNIAPEVWTDVHEYGGIFLRYPDERGSVGYPGKTRTEILTEFANYLLPDDITEEGWWTGGREDWPSCLGRAIRVARQLKRRANEGSEESVAIVSHGAFIDALLKALMNQLPSRYFYYSHYNTAMTQLNFFPERRFSIRYMNRVAHLPLKMLT